MQSFLLQDRVQAGCGVGEPDEFATEVDAFEEGGKDTALGNDAGQDDAVGFWAALRMAGTWKEE